MSIMTGFEQFRFRTTLIFLTFPGWGGGSGKIEIKASLIPTELELGLSLANKVGREQGRTTTNNNKQKLRKFGKNTLKKNLGLNGRNIC